MMKKKWKKKKKKNKKKNGSFEGKKKEERKKRGKEKKKKEQEQKKKKKTGGWGASAWCKVSLLFVVREGRYLTVFFRHPPRPGDCSMWGIAGTKPPHQKHAPRRERTRRMRFFFFFPVGRPRVHRADALVTGSGKSERAPGY